MSQRQLILKRRLLDNFAKTSHTDYDGDQADVVIAGSGSQTDRLDVLQ